MRLSDPELVVRSALFPKFLLESGVFAAELVVSPFTPITLEDGRPGYALSVGARSMLPTIADVHGFGCRVATEANARIAAKSEAPPVRGVDTFHYRGSYELEVKEVRAIEAPAFDIEVTHCPENNLGEHCHIELRTKDGISKTQSGKARTGVIAKLYRLLLRPTEHICPGDEDLRSLLEEYHLPEVQGG